MSNANISPQDLDGDGIIDFLHMPRVKTYSVYTPEQRANVWFWAGRVVTTASEQSPKIDFGRDASDLRVMDVNGDGLVDVVRTTGTQVETYFALGRLPGGDGRFGRGRILSAAAAQLSNEVVTCVPHSARPVQFGDPVVKLADMNGDGLPDIVRVQRGDIRYWPGRGNGLWGTGSLDNCPGGSFGSGRDIRMGTSPYYSDIQGNSLRLDDVNGDGLDDLVQIRFNEVDIWLNVDGVGWTERYTIRNTPASPSYADRVRLVDINGSGTRDILWGHGGNYRYIDLLGGKRPWVLTSIANGLGKTTEIEYRSSTELMLEDEAAGRPWTSKVPMPLHVVSRVTESDNLVIVGRPPGK